MECNGGVIGDRNRLSFCAFSIVFALFMFEKGLLCSFYNVYQMRVRKLLKV